MYSATAASGYYGFYLAELTLLLTPSDLPHAQTRQPHDLVRIEQLVLVSQILFYICTSFLALAAVGGIWVIVFPSSMVTKIQRTTSHDVKRCSLGPGESLGIEGCSESPSATISQPGNRIDNGPMSPESPKTTQAKSLRYSTIVDTLEVRPLPGAVLKHFTARDMVFQCDVLEVHPKATAATAKGFLDSLVSRMPFTIKAFQVDG